MPAILEKHLGILSQTSRCLPWVPAASFLVTYHRDILTQVHRGTCHRIFITISFMVMRSWRSHSCPSLGKWISSII